MAQNRDYGKKSGTAVKSAVGMADGGTVGFWERMRAGNIDKPGSEAWRRWGEGSRYSSNPPPGEEDVPRAYKQAGSAAGSDVPPDDKPRDYPQASSAPTDVRAARGDSAQSISDSQVSASGGKADNAPKVVPVAKRRKVVTPASQSTGSWKNSSRENDLPMTREAVQMENRRKISEGRALDDVPIIRGIKALFKADGGMVGGGRSYGKKSR